MGTFEQMVAMQLDKILSSDGFSSAPHLRQFLSYIVNTYIQNKSGKIDAYNIATQALDRPDDFAPDLDPIVRVQAAKLRQRLNLYNASMGAKDFIQITLPKGGYVPVIEYKRSGFNDERDPASLDDISVIDHNSSVLPTIFVEKFDCDGTLYFQTLSENMKTDLVLTLNRFDAINVIPSNGESNNYSTLSGNYVYRLYGHCRLEDDKVDVDVFLVNVRSGICIYSKKFMLCTDQDLAAAKTWIISEISSSIAEISGVIFKDVDEQYSANGLSKFDAIGLIVQSYKYADHPNETGFELAKSDIKKALKLSPNMILALCRLSFTYLDGYRFLFGGVDRSREYLPQTITNVIRAKELSPSSSMVNLLQSDVLFLSGKIEEAIKAGEFAIAQNPENHVIAAIHGFRRAMFGDWEGGLKYVRNAASLGYYLPNRYLLIELYHSVFIGDYESAMEYSELVKLPDFFMYHVYVAGLHDQLGNVHESKKAFEMSLKLRPGLSMDEIWEINIRASTKEFAEATRKLIKNVGYA